MTIKSSMRYSKLEYEWNKIEVINNAANKLVYIYSL